MPIRQHYGLSPDLLSAKHEGQQLLKKRGDYLMPAFKLLKLALMGPCPAVSTMTASEVSGYTRAGSDFSPIP